MGERGPAYMTGRGMIGIVALMTAGCGDAKLALASLPADPLRFPAWGFTFRIENQRRLASAALRCPEAGVAAARRLRPASKRGA
jgi:hypothetical protein